ncbi:radical SAM superfamily protein, partial [Xanthomonas arboricola pv. pruni str. MAFF 311562]
MIPAAPLALQPSPPPTLQPPRWQQQWRDAVRDPRALLALLGLEAQA